MLNTSFWTITLVTWLQALCFVDCLPRSPQENASAIRLVYSMTTNPERIHSLWETIESLLFQEKGWMPDLIQINVPWIYKRSNQTFGNLDKISILKHPLVRTHRCEDNGPITKLLGALETETDPDTLVVVVDDDYKYPSFLTRIMKVSAAAEPDHAVVGRCGDWLVLLNPATDFQQGPFTNYKPNDPERPCCCRFMEGFGGVGYRVGFFTNLSSTNFTEYLNVALRHTKCFRSDDYLISNYLALQGIQGVFFNRPYNVVPTKANGDHLALWKQHYVDHDGTQVGHPYYNCSLYLKAKGISSVFRINAPKIRHNRNAIDGSLLQCSTERTVYLVENQTRRAFQSGTGFTRGGYDFGNIQKVAPEDCQFHIYWMPEGPPML